MNCGYERTAILKLEIPGRSLATRLLDRWSEQFGLSLNVLRGRVTSEEALLEVEARGEAAAVAELLREILPWCRPRRKRVPALTGVLA